MAVGDDHETRLVADLWDLVEGWSSGAIQRAREAATDGPSEATDAEVRLLIAHAADLRAVIEEHLARETTPSYAASPAEPAAEPEAPGEPQPEAEPAPAADHICNSADFERPPCAECHGSHWYCSICGAQQDDCRSA